MKAVASLLLACAVPLMAASVASAEDYPARPVTFVVPFAPGGATDILGRLVGQKLTDRLGKTFVVENRPGAGTATAATQVSKAAPDGYTIHLNGSALWLLPFMRTRVPYDAVRDFTPVTLAVATPNVLVVHPAVTVKSVRDLIALAKAKPGTLDFASSGSGGDPPRDDRLGDGGASSATSTR